MLHRRFVKTLSIFALTTGLAGCASYLDENLALNAETSSDLLTHLPDLDQVSGWREYMNTAYTLAPYIPECQEGVGFERALSRAVDLGSTLLVRTLEGSRLPDVEFVSNIWAMDSSAESHEALTLFSGFTDTIDCEIRDELGVRYELAADLESLLGVQGNGFVSTATFPSGIFYQIAVVQRGRFLLTAAVIRSQGSPFTKSSALDLLELATRKYLERVK